MKNSTARKLREVPPGCLVVGVEPHKKRHAAVIMNPYLTAKLEARENKGWGLPTELSVRFKAGPLTKGYIVCCWMERG